MKPATAEEAFKQPLALKKIERDFEDEKIRTNFEVWQDARKLAAEFTPEGIGYVSWAWYVQRSKTAFQKLKLHVKNHYHLNHPVVALVGKARRRGMAVVETNAVTEIDDREGGRRDFKPEVKK